MLKSLFGQLEPLCYCLHEPFKAVIMKALKSVIILSATKKDYVSHNVKDKNAVVKKVVILR